MSKIIGTVLAIIALLTLLLPLDSWSREDISINIKGGYVGGYVKGGSFNFKNLNMTQGKTVWESLNRTMYGFPRLKGDIVNNTNNDWLSLEFEVDLYDIAGNKLKDDRGESFKFLVSDIKRGTTKPIEPGYGKEFTSINLTKVEVSRYEIRFKEGEYRVNYKFGMIKPKQSKNFLFEDTFINIEFSLSKSQISFIIANKTPNPIKIDWNQVSYIDVLNKSHKVIHSGVKFIDKDKVQAPTIIPPTAKIEDIVLPIDNISYISGEYSGWNQSPLFPEGERAKLFKGKTFSMFMPLEINNKIKNYFFTFIIEDVTD